MKASIYTQYGPPEIVSIQEIAKPIPKNNEILIKVYASTVNRTDCGFRSANYFVVRFFTGLFKPKKQYHVLGTEFAGMVESVGEEVKLFVPGDCVFGFDDATCGGHAQFMAIGEDKAIAKIPDGMDFKEAAPIGEGAHYALCDIKAAKIKAGQQVMVYGGTGAIGSAAIQILKQMGVEVTAVADTKNLDLMRAIGADTVIDYTTTDMKSLTQRFDVIFDAVGKMNFGISKPLLKEKGIYMSTELGPRSENPFLAIYTPWLGGKKVLFPIPTNSKADMEFLAKLVADGDFKPVIDREFALDDIIEAYRYVETGQKIGNVIIRIPQDE